MHGQHASTPGMLSGGNRIDRHDVQAKRSQTYQRQTLLFLVLNDVRATLGVRRVNTSMA